MGERTDGRDERAEREGREADDGRRRCESTPESTPEFAATGSEVRDLAGLRADDALLDELGASDPDLGDAFSDAELHRLLLAWRREADSEPLAELVDTETALAVITTAKTAPARKRFRLLVPVASAAAVLAIAFGGVSVAAHDAHPGDALWGLTQVLYAGHARSVAAAVSVRDEFVQARAALASGQTDDALTALSHAKQVIPTVAPEDGKAELRQTRQVLVEKANGPVDQSPTTTQENSGQPVVPPATSSTTVDRSSSPTTMPSSSPSTTTQPPTSSPTQPPTSSLSPTPSTTSVSPTPTSTMRTQSALVGGDDATNDGTTSDGAPSNEGPDDGTNASSTGG